MFEKLHQLVGGDEAAAIRIVGMVRPFAVVPGSDTSVIVEHQVDANTVFACPLQNAIQFPGISEMVVAGAVIPGMHGGPFQSQRPGAHPDFREIGIGFGHAAKIASIGQAAFGMTKAPGKLFVHAFVEGRADIMSDGKERAAVIEGEMAGRGGIDAHEAGALRGYGVELYRTPFGLAPGVPYRDEAAMAPRDRRAVADAPVRTPLGHQRFSDAVRLAEKIAGEESMNKVGAAIRGFDGCGEIDKFGVERIGVAVRKVHAQFEEVVAGDGFPVGAQVAYKGWGRGGFGRNRQYD